MERPRTRYARGGEAHIPCQVLVLGAVEDFVASRAISFANRGRAAP